MYKLKKIKNGPIKIENSRIPARNANSILIWIQKDTSVKEILLLEVWVRRVGSTPIVHGMDSYPVNKCILIFI